MQFYLYLSTDWGIHLWALALHQAPGSASSPCALILTDDTYSRSRLRSWWQLLTIQTTTQSALPSPHLHVVAIKLVEVVWPHNSASRLGNHPPVQPLILLHQPLKLSCVVALLCMRRGRCSPCGCPLLLACSCCSGQQLAQLCTSACVAQEVWRAGVGSALMQDYGTLAGASRGVMCSRGVGVQAAEVYKARGVQWTLMLMWRLKG